MGSVGRDRQVRAGAGLSHLHRVADRVCVVWLASAKRAHLARFHLHAYVNPVVAVLLGNWLAAEPLGPRIGLAAAIIVGSVMFVNRSRPGVRKEAVVVSEQ